METEYPIGTKYFCNGDKTLIHTVTDVWKTHNSKGELLQTSYVTTREDDGKIISHHGVRALTITRWLISTP